jgi:hypothetical protein
MPCTDGGVPYERDTVMEDRLKRRVTKLESLLCSTCRELEERKYDFDKNPRLSEWWAKHKAEDEERERKELQEMNRRKLAKHIASTTNIMDLSPQHKAFLKEFGYL